MRPSLFRALLSSFLAVAACQDEAGDPSRSIQHFAQADQAADWSFTSQGRIEASGGLRRLGTQMNGVLADVLVQEGQQIARGQLLARLICDEKRAQADASKAELQAASAEMEKVRAGSRTEEIQAAEASLGGARATLTDAEAAYKRNAALAKTGVVSNRSVDAATAALRVARADANRAASQLALLRSGSRREDIARATAQREAARKGLEAATTAVTHCDVRSPVSGVVARINKRGGEQVTTAAPENIIEVVDTTDLRIRSEVDERYVSQVAPGQPVEFWLEGDRRRYRGRVERLTGSMGRKQAFAQDPSDQTDREVQEVIIRPLGEGFPKVHGLRVIVGFERRP